MFEKYFLRISNLFIAKKRPPNPRKSFGKHFTMFTTSLDSRTHRTGRLIDLLFSMFRRPTGTQQALNIQSLIAQTRSNDNKKTTRTGITLRRTLDFHSAGNENIKYFTVIGRVTWNNRRSFFLSRKHRQHNCFARPTWVQPGDISESGLGSCKLWIVYFVCGGGFAMALHSCIRHA